MDLHRGTVESIKRHLELDPSLYEETVDDEIKWKGRIFSADLLKVRLPDGSYGTREIAWHHGGCGVAAFREGKLCLVRQYRVALGCMTLEIPAGKLAPGEDPLACAERELKEETGFTAQKMAYLTTIATSAGFADELIHIYMATGLKLAESSPDADEFINVDLVDVGELVDAVLDGRIEDAKTVVGALICDAVSRRLDPGPVPEDQQQ